MQRLLAILLLSAINFPLMPLAATTQVDNSLPPCCRISGKHKCALKRAALRNRSEPAIAGLEERCPARLGLVSATTGSHGVFLQPGPARFGPVLTQTSPRVQTEALGRISFSRTRQKRGPPILVLNQLF